MSESCVDRLHWRLDALAITLGGPCPCCWCKNCLAVAGRPRVGPLLALRQLVDGGHIGLLANMLRTSQ